MALGAVIFDCDGVLVDSEPVHRAALRTVLAPHGVALTDAEYARRYLGVPDREAFAVARRRHRAALAGVDVETLRAAKERLVAAALDAAPLQPGLLPLLDALRDVPLAVASGALRAEVRRILARAALRGRFRAVVGAEDVARGKPDPAPFVEAWRRLRRAAPALAREACVVVEDAPPGVVAARRAGMRVVAVTTSRAARALAGADLVVRSLADLDRARLAALCA